MTSTSAAIIKRKVLCLHGKRTSAKIMNRQMSAMRYHTSSCLDYIYIDAPYPAEGLPDEGIQMFYPNENYYEWYLRREREDGSIDYHGIEKSTDIVIDYLWSHGPFDGIVGFSQGASLASRLAYLQQNKLLGFESGDLFRFVILIGGQEAMDIPKEVTQ